MKKKSAALNVSANLEKSAVATGLETVSFHSNPKKGNAKGCLNYDTTELVSHAGKHVSTRFTCYTQNPSH